MLRVRSGRGVRGRRRGRNEKTPSLFLTSESHYTRQIVELATLRGWRVVHFLPARYAQSDSFATHFIGHKGFPDLIMVRPPRIIVAELKMPSGRIHAEQEAWLKAFAGCPCVETYIWIAGVNTLEEIDAILSQTAMESSTSS